MNAPTSLPDDWPTVADVYRPTVNTARHEDGRRTIFVDSVEVATAGEETFDAIYAAVFATVDRIGKFAIRPFPWEDR